MKISNIGFSGIRQNTVKVEKETIKDKVDLGGTQPDREMEKMDQLKNMKQKSGSEVQDPQVYRNRQILKGAALVTAGVLGIAGSVFAAANGCNVAMVMGSGLSLTTAYMGAAMING